MILVPAYSVLFALFFVFLSAKVIVARRAAKVALGTGRNKQLERIARVHSNFAEYVPFTLLLISFVEQRGLHPFIIHSLCCLFLLGRALHAWGVSKEVENFKYRVAGMILTFSTILGAALCIGYSYLS